jgi:hypothetical protein
LNETVEVNIETAKMTKKPATGPVWTPEDTVSEVARLFQSDDESTEEESILVDQVDGLGAIPAEPSDEKMWCEEAIRVQFDQGWHAHFADDDMLNVARDDGLDQRYVRALRAGDRVLLIHGQQRQSLYDLLISRIHKHPSIELHLAMIRRWQDDLSVAFSRWKSGIADPAEVRMHGLRDVNGLLRRMQTQGSQLVANLTLSFWLRGLVLCPLDPEDLRRVAVVLDMGFVRQHYKRIGQAANRLRGLHRGLSTKLNRWLQDRATGPAHKSDDDVIDAELGLTFGDVQNSLLVLRVMSVESVENVRGPFLNNNLGRVEKDSK